MTDGFKLLFSFHPSTEAISQTPSGLFNCSQHYEAFRQHLDCNLRQECQGGEDETEACPYTSSLCPPESLYYQDKCFVFHSHSRWTDIRKVCLQQGGDLAMLKTAESMEALRYLVDKRPVTPFAFVGLQRDLSKGPMYRRMWFWIDGSPDFYNGNMYNKDLSLNDNVCVYVSLQTPVQLYSCQCAACELPWSLCQLDAFKNDSIDEEQKQVILISTTFDFDDLVYIGCVEKHFTHGFLSCHADSNCLDLRASYHRCEFTATYRETTNATSLVDELVTVSMFECEKYGETVHYTLVCDFRPDCTDGSDETRCQHREDGQGFRCSYGQWIDDRKLCDMRDDCLDGSDEQLCDNYRTENMETFSRPQAPVIIHMDGRGSFTMEAMDPADPTCPQTHFRCPGQHVYCMPVYLRCNGVKDCLGGEDEVSCDDVTCPSYYRCRSSSVCLHGDHLCDGWPQCPERDDELLCNASCPSACHCQGLAFVCQQPFAASHYPDLRYLDATGSGMVPEDVADNLYLIFLNFTACELTIWPDIGLYNLQMLDLSNNVLSTLYLQRLFLLKNLRSLILKGNPLYDLLGQGYNTTLPSVVVLDLSNTSLSVLSSQILHPFPSVKHLNMSHSRLHTISEKALDGMPNLQMVDVRGCDINTFPGDLFHGLQELTIIYAKTFKLCCKDMLPAGFNADSCFAPQDEISSCADLLRSNFYRVFLWIFVFMAVVGNAGSIIFKLLYQRKDIMRSGYNVFVTSLCLSDFFMGLYLVLIGAADELYRGRYAWDEKQWKESALCQLAGFLSLLSNEVSAFMICLITLDRFIVLRFPFSTVRFKGRSAVSASALAWTVGLLLAAVPLLPSLSHWSFYSQTGICIPLPITRTEFPGKNYSFGIMIIFNFIQFILIAFGQMFIYWSIRSNSMSLSDSTSMSQNLTIARRLITVVVSDFLCWFPVGVLGLTAFSGLPVPGEASVAVAIFVLPLNSALNPFLYTYNMLMEKRRLRHEAKLLESLHSQISTKQISDAN